MKLLALFTIRPHTVLILLVALISASSLKANFLFIDDIELIVNNPGLNFSVAEILALFSQPLGQIYAADHSLQFIYYRPALTLLYMVNNAIWGINPVGFHLTNLCLHLATTLLIYRTGMLLFDRNRGVSLIAAALFSVHPVHNEIIGRVAMNENLLGFFVAAALYFYLKNNKLLSLSAFVCALLSKESAVMLPFALLLLELKGSDLKKTVSVLSPYMIMLSVYLVVRTMVVGFPGNLQINPDLVESAIMICSALADYIRLLVIPYPLSIYYPALRIDSPFQPEMLIPVIICILLGFALWKWRHDRLLSPLLLGIIIMLAPVVFNANRLILGIELGYIAERQLYVPAIFFSLLIAGIIAKYSAFPAGKCLAAAMMGVIPVFLCLTLASMRVWENDDVLISRFMHDFPGSSISHLSKGHILYKQGDLDGALHECEAILPSTHAGVHRARGRASGNADRKTILAAKPKPDGSSENANERRQSDSVADFLVLHGLADYNPRLASVHFQMGQVFLAKNDLEHAINKFKVTLALQPHYLGGHTQLAEAYMRKGMIQAARREYKLALHDLNLKKAVSYRDTEIQRLLCQ